MTIASVGELMFDVFPDLEIAGGTALNLAVHSAGLGHKAIVVSAVGRDDRGNRMIQVAARHSIVTRFIEQTSQQPTGTVTVAFNGDDAPRFEIHRPAAYDCVRLDLKAAAELSSMRPGWVSFSTLFSMNGNSHRVLRRVLDALPDALRFYNVSVGPAACVPELIRELALLSDVVKLNECEVEVVAHILRIPFATTEQFARRSSEEFRWKAVAVIKNDGGCALLRQREYVEIQGERIGDPGRVGGDDAFAAAFVHGLEAGWHLHQIGRFANLIGAVEINRDRTLRRSQADARDHQPEFCSCFISYSHADKSFATRLHEELQGRGIPCWLDEKQLLPGDDIYDNVYDAIRIWDKVLICCSEHSLSSWWVENELAAAFEKEQRLRKERGKKVPAVIPLNIDGYLFSDRCESGKALPLRHRKAADFMGWRTDARKFIAGVEELLRALRLDREGH